MNAQNELFPPPEAKKIDSPVRTTYRDNATGATWYGRGITPRWLTEKLAAGAALADFVDTRKLAAA